MRGAIWHIGPWAVFEGEGSKLVITQKPLVSQESDCFLDCGVTWATPTSSLPNPATTSR